MIAPDSKNGGSPSRNGAARDKDKDKEHDGPEVVLTIVDRLDALERALGTVRRRGMCLQIHSVSRRDGALQLVLRAESGALVPERWIAELAALVDVKQIKTNQPTS